MKLRELIDLYNFRQYRDEIKLESLKYDTNIVRIYFDENIGTNHYVEFGIYDFGEDEYKQEIYETFINKKMLERKVESIYFDYDLNTFCIHLGSDK